MCEWLSRREWCDVLLRCGGRSLGAHRAVLASVSSFLRRILLSCPTEDTPTCIVLPDFDLEAMSLVLYYIYNGEVVIQKQKFEMFMEIVKAMQIFIDKQYLPSTNKDTEGVHRQSPNQFETSEVFTLGNDNESVINLKKGDDMPHVLRINYNDQDIQGTRERFEDWRKQICFGNVQSTHGDRQRSFFLRDLYIETYPRNGNANGRAAGVPAIPNERYRRAASVLLTNANGKHLGSDNAHSDMHFNTADLPQYIFPLQKHCTQNTYSSNNESRMSYPDLLHMKTFNSECSSFDTTMFTASSNYFSSSRSSFESFKMDHLLLQKPRTPLMGTPELSEKSSLDLTSNNLIPLNKPFSHFHKDSLKLKDTYLSETESINNTHKSTRGNVSSRNTILNQVLDSPWCPRQPKTYRPFRRKINNLTNVFTKDVKENIVNDDNNNIETDVADRIPLKEATEPLYSMPSHVSGTEFKCTTCNQVFADAEGLETHSRRHSSNARYSCTECSKSFSQLRNFKYHMSVHRGTREFAATCTVCGKYFNDRGYLSSHMKIHRNRKEYKCTQCPKSFNQRVAYNMHVRIHTGIKPHVCEECGKAFSRKMLLKQHQRTHSGERPYACPHCDKRFADRSNMTLHLRLHTGIKPFSCTLCPKSFTKKHHLKSHLNFHTGAKPYSCPRCKLAFTQSSNMRTHLKKCTVVPESLNNADTVLKK